MLCLPNGSKEARDESHLQQDKHGREGKNEIQGVWGGMVGDQVGQTH